MKINETNLIKEISSDDYNYFFNKKTGYFERWGKTEDEDPDMAPSPEIADIEVTTICNGVGGKLCKHCYKSNTPNGRNMSFETFVKVFDKISENKVLTQIAFGADASATANADLFKMMEYSRENGVIPNITVAEITPETAKKLANVCGAVAVSRYKEKDACYDSIKYLNEAGMNQVNIHVMVSEETYEMCLETLDDRKNDKRLKDVKAVIFLSLKTKGRGIGYTPLSQEKFNQLVNKALKNEIRIGFDSCSSFKFLKSIEKHPKFDHINKYVESCESTLFSIFINYKGEALPCSFSEGCSGWSKGIDVVECEDFVKDVWENEQMKLFRNKLLGTCSGNKFGCRECPLYKV